jgi:hypothetical protein
VAAGRERAQRPVGAHPCGSESATGRSGHGGRAGADTAAVRERACRHARDTAASGTRRSEGGTCDLLQPTRGTTASGARRHAARAGAQDARWVERPEGIFMHSLIFITLYFFKINYTEDHRYYMKANISFQVLVPDLIKGEITRKGKLIFKI